MKTLILNTEETLKHLSVDMAVETIDYVFRELGSGRINMPPKAHTDMSGIGHEAWCNAMPAYLKDRQVGGIKWIGGFGENRNNHLPYIMGLLVLTNPDNGFVKSVMDARLISDYRTGASAAVFSRYLCHKPLEDILIVGSGAQGQMAARCLHYEHPAAQISLFDLDVEKVKQFKQSLDGTSLGDQLQVCTDLVKAAARSRLIVMLTTAQKPFFRNEWILPGTTVLGMGSYQQVEGEFALNCDKIITDSWEQAKHRGELQPLSEAGQITDDNLFCELSDVVVGRKPGRENDSELIFGLPIGLGAYDVAIADIVYEKAKVNHDGLSVLIQQA
ncbi:MAG: ornithine cyclodeaminase family protein [Eubacteriales bacterium]|jgi:ornithine cyclodeaminase/alanine dehydrogenase-like protein (mu-crystallin family)|nr:ornithine cyclodeaminase family protein [Eubacteriales bacterium]